MKLPIPAWAGSLVFHLFGLLLLFLLVRSTPDIRGAPGVERTDHVGIVLKSESQDGSVYHNETETFEKSQSAGGSAGAAESTEFLEPLTANPTFNPSQFLPTTPKNVIGPTAVESASVDSAQADHLSPRPGTGLGGSGAGTGRGSGSGATVGVFNLTGTGYRFAFVFDRSDSMRDPGNRPIQAAKAELIRALDSLQSVHQFLIVFYNEEPSIYPTGERSARLIYATDDNKEAAKRYIRSITPAGGTDHEKALVEAARQRPDVIFLLTDGEAKDDLNAAQLDRITRLSGSAQINVVQFGFGPEPRGRNYLKLLAAQNAGQYQYIDFR